MDDPERRPLLDEESQRASPDAGQVAVDGGKSWSGRNRWIVLAIASGGCAAFNGVFAKL